MASATSTVSMEEIEPRHTALREELAQYNQLAIALSGGVDSTMLAAVAHQVLGSRAMMVHAESPAVPVEATKRVRQCASRYGWRLKVVDAREFTDQQYRQNPVDRCYFCKSNLYTRIHEVWQGPVASGANLDDLGDYRPGLLAAKEKRVVHPLIDAKIDKATVRAIAAMLGLDAVADLPAQPCLSSRIETGIAIDAQDLLFVHKVETLVASRLGPGNIRCRIVATGVRLEVEYDLQSQNVELWQDVRKEVSEIVSASGRQLAGFTDYERGSAFLTGILPEGKINHE